ncbi:DUF1501 domain-containing protein [Tautonia plasticadhaerens]|uniref:Sulfatase n=1 Tax=Tautonia plasticadhaerens TaxID=2527974 RepID=A0A518HE03_9BACT|nr:DUF1501 domain-containing protein [Tautonia plasticadhaerens]QDV39081.1 hypothetical protein ElP_70440 [Tautonia plasticadhaerens]
MSIDPTRPGEPGRSFHRRRFFSRAGLGIGTAALASLLDGEGRRAVASDSGGLGLPGVPHLRPKATRMISLFMSGGPSQLETFDHKPLLVEMTGKDLPDSVRQGQRLTGMSANQASLPLAGSLFRFDRHGESGGWVSELLPHTAGVVDELCIIKSVYTEAINHDPAITFLQTGSQIAGRPSVGAWLSYGLGSENADLPAFCVLITKDKGGQPLYSRLWGSGFLPSTHQGVLFRSGSDPVLYLQNPEGISGSARKMMLDRLRELHQIRVEETLDPALDARIEQYEMAYRMQASVPEVTDLSDEPDSTFDLYGPDARTPGTFAANCLLARRLVERGVRFIQLFHQGWDHHGGLPAGIRVQCAETDQPSAALVIDLKRRGLLEDTLVTWGGEFGRTNYSQGKLTADDYGRDHHPRCFSVWMAGGGVKAGLSFGSTDEFGYNVAEDPVHVHDLHATILHLLGIDHERLTFKYQGRYFRLTDVHGRVLAPLLS